LRYGSLSFDQNTRLFAVKGTELHLSPREHVLLETLLRKAGATVSKEMLLESSYGFGEDVNLSAIEVHVHRLRKKLENSGVSIATLRGLGYLLRLDAS
jgi:two-component system, OmpR family, response regulator TctD